MLAIFRISNTTIRQMIALSLMILLMMVSTPDFSKAQDDPIDTVRDLGPTLLGFEGRQSYLIMVQLSDELRPSGGLSLVFMRVDLVQGRATRIEVIDVNAAEIPESGSFSWVETGQRIPPPDAIERYMGLGNWVIQDANWWLDFRAAAAQVEQFWEAAGFAPVDAVIALNDMAIAELLGAIGGFTASDGTMLDAGSFKTFLIERFYLADEGTIQRGQSGRALVDLVNEFLSLSDEQNEALLTTALEQALQNNLMIVTDNPATNEQFTALGYSGALQTENTSDYFYINEANLSYNPINSFVTPRLEYTGTLSANGDLHSTLFIETSNQFTANAADLPFPNDVYIGARYLPASRAFSTSSGYYGSLLRVVIPEDAVFSRLLGFDSISATIERRTRANVAGGYVSLNPGETQLILTEWDRSEVLLDDGDVWRLFVQKQPGAPASELQITLNHEGCAEALTISPEPTMVNGNTIVWAEALEQNSIFVVEGLSVTDCEAVE